MISNLFKNIEKTICTIGKMLFWLSCALPALGLFCIILASSAHEFSLYIVGGVLLGFCPIGIVSSFFVYGFGVLISEVKKIRASNKSTKIDMSTLPKL